MRPTRGSIPRQKPEHNTCDESERKHHTYGHYLRRLSSYHSFPNSKGTGHRRSLKHTFHLYYIMTVREGDVFKNVTGVGMGRGVVGGGGGGLIR